jgi:TetR/AcrR family transcriptional regulator
VANRAKSSVSRAARAARGSRARDRERHEAEILEAAERTFAAQGFEGATMAAIAAEAGFSTGTLYNRFESKEALLGRLLAARMEAFAADAGRAVAAQPRPRAKLEAYAVARVRHLARHRAFFRLYLTEIPGVLRHLAPRPGEGIVALVEAQRRLLRGIFEALPRAPLDAALRALLFDAALRAFTAEHVLAAKRTPGDAEVRAVARGLLEGLG